MAATSTSSTRTRCCAQSRPATGCRSGRESYACLVLPGCRELPGGAAEVIAAFLDGGGIVVAIGDAPHDLDSRVRRIATAVALPAALVDLPRRVACSSPTLLRADGESAALLVLAGQPSATVQPGGDRWQTQGYDFDPSRYAESTTVAVRGVSEPVAAWDPGTGGSTPLAARREGDVLHVEVPLRLGPCALVVFGPAAATHLTPTGEMADPGPSLSGELPLTDWTGTVLPTLDNTWGDFAQPPSTAPLPLARWHLEHEVAGEWRPVTVTFGPGGYRREGRAAGLVGQCWTTGGASGRRTARLRA